MSENFGYITQVIGPVVDVSFEGEGNSVPPIYAALKIERNDDSDLLVEVEQHIGENTVRCVAMDSTDGLVRGMKVVNLGRPLSMTTGDQVKGRLMNVMGEAIDHLPALDYTNVKSIHQEAPAFDELTVSTEFLFTGIKVIDLLEPYSRGGKIGLFGGAGVGKTVLINLSSDLQRYAYNMCKKYGVNYETFLALMYTESKYNPNAVSSTNDYGICQINSSNHKYLRNVLGVTDFFNPYENIKAGVYWLARYYNSWGYMKDSPEYEYNVLNSYNFGTGAYYRYLDNGNSPYSWHYAKKIISVKNDLIKNGGI